MPTLTDQQVSELKLAHKQSREKRLADRIKAILYLHYGLSVSEISKLLLFDEVTVSRYRKQYQEKGLPGLLELHYSGGKTTLILTQELELKEYLRDNTKRTAKEIVAYVSDTYQVKFSVIGITKLLHRLGFSYKKPKIVPGKADRFKQEQFLQKYEEIKTSLSKNDQIYFLDSIHPAHNTLPSYGWILKGKENDKIVKTNSGRDHINLCGALNLKNHKMVVLDEKTVNKFSTIRMLERLKSEHPTGKIYLILDNATYYHAKEVKAWVKKHRRFKLIYLPSYSPNLNLIERLWRFFHQKVLWNHYFETMGQFKTASLEFFENLDIHKKELDTLLADNFRLVPNLNLQT